MEFSRTETFLRPAFEDGAVTFGVYLAREAEFDDSALNEAIEKWADGEDVFMNFRFSVRECVEDIVDGRRIAGFEDVVLEENDRPMVNALRQELLDMVARLDQVRFVP
jgi:hypothetical protein